MDHPIVKVVNFEIVKLYTLHILFDDGHSETINFEPILHGFYYAPLRDPDQFNQVQIDPETHTLVWPNGADFDPATLYNWHRGEGQQLAQRTAAWQAAELNG